MNNDEVNSLTRFTPAYAGNTHGDVLLHALLKVHPRIRGEYFPTLDALSVPLGSPPHTRGIRRVCAQD